ncbi:serine-threonine protein kinase, putative [Bodo saltans]|uniref:non-specific serine/threonine protein kinase n=1 Tax=Bodo saltans TaxID=75058 RepID=A0A0S4J3Q5_BODSA|nr:serine-threonine protein kinase, putative [Bodo saltans]|eukprot:CUG35280.1 serine-threonine protein kinase, putative [Bodo saltans]
MGSIFSKLCPDDSHENTQKKTDGNAQQDVTTASMRTKDGAEEPLLRQTTDEAREDYRAYSPRESGVSNTAGAGGRSSNSIKKQPNHSNATNTTDGEHHHTTRTSEVLKNHKSFQTRSGGSAAKSLKDYELLAFLGQGSFAEVTLARHKSTRQLFAIKKISKRKIKEAGSVEQTFTERQILASLKHPFLVRLHQAFQSASDLYFVLQFAHGGDFRTFLQMFRADTLPRHPALQSQHQHSDATTTRDNGCHHTTMSSLSSQKDGCLPLDYVFFYAVEVAIALIHLHEHGFIYRDLKPENILMQRDGHIMLTDFGVAKQYMTVTEAQQQKQQQQHRNRSSTNGHVGGPPRSDEQERKENFVGTREYMSPEILQGAPHDKQTDWWSYGCWLHEMAVGRGPFDGARSEYELYQNVVETPDLEEKVRSGMLSCCVLPMTTTSHATPPSLFSSPASTDGFPSSADQTVQHHRDPSELNGTAAAVASSSVANDSLVMEMARKERNAEVCENLMSLIVHLLCRDPSRRLGGPAVLEHPFFRLPCWQSRFDCFAPTTTVSVADGGEIRLTVEKFTAKVVEPPYIPRLRGNEDLHCFPCAVACSESCFATKAKRAAATLQNNDHENNEHDNLPCDGNQLSGTLPASYATLAGGLVFSNNRFRGTIPAAWSNMTRVSSVTLSSNCLVGPMPVGLSSIITVCNTKVMGGRIPSGCSGSNLWPSGCDSFYTKTDEPTTSATATATPDGQSASMTLSISRSLSASLSFSVTKSVSDAHTTTVTDSVTAASVTDNATLTIDQTATYYSRRLTSTVSSAHSTTLSSSHTAPTISRGASLSSSATRSSTLAASSTLPASKSIMTHSITRSLQVTRASTPLTASASASHEVSSTPSMQLHPTTTLLITLTKSLSESKTRSTSTTVMASNTRSLTHSMRLLPTTTLLVTLTKSLSESKTRNASTTVMASNTWSLSQSNSATLSNNHGHHDASICEVVDGNRADDLFSTIVYDNATITALFYKRSEQNRTTILLSAAKSAALKQQGQLSVSLVLRKHVYLQRPLAGKRIMLGTNGLSAIASAMSPSVIDIQLVTSGSQYLDLVTTMQLPLSNLDGVCILSSGAAAVQIDFVLTPTIVTALSVMQSVSSIVGPASAASASPASAIAVTRLAILQALLSCNVVATADGGNSLIGLSLGPVAGGYMRGAVVGNIFIVVCFVAATGLLLLGFMLYGRMAHGHPFHRTVGALQATFHVPGVLMLPIAAVCQPTLTASVQLIAMQPVAGDRLFGILGVVAVLLLMLPFTVAVLCTFCLELSTGSAEEQQMSTVPLKDHATWGKVLYLKAILFQRRARWVPRSQDAAAVRWKQQFGPIFADSATWWFPLVDMWISAAVGVVGGVTLNQTSVCRGQLLFVGLVYLASFMLQLFLVQPIRFIVRIYCASVQLLGVISCIAVAAALYQGVEAETTSVLVASYSMLLIAAISTLKSFTDCVALGIAFPSTVRKAQTRIASLPSSCSSLPPSPLDLPDEDIVVDDLDDEDGAPPPPPEEEVDDDDHPFDAGKRRAAFRSFLYSDDADAPLDFLQHIPVASRESGFVGSGSMHSEDMRNDDDEDAVDVLAGLDLSPISISTGGGGSATTTTMRDRAINPLLGETALPATTNDAFERGREPSLF